MAKVPTIDDIPISVDDYPSKYPYAENVVEKDPPSYACEYPLSNNTYNVGQNTIQSQPQPQFVPTGNVVVTTAHVPKVVNPVLNDINNYQCWSILNILCCCICLGAVACYYSSKTDSALLRGDIQGALNASRNARTFNIIATVIGVIIITLNIINQVMKY